MSIKLYGSMGLLILVLFTTCQDGDGEREIQGNLVPPAVRTNFEKAYPNVLVEEYTEEKEDGVVCYEIEFVSQGQKIVVVYDQAGNLLETETLIPPANLPQAILQTLSGRFAKFSIDKDELVEKAEDTFFEVELNSYENNVPKLVEVTLDSTGHIHAEERK